MSLLSPNVFSELYQKLAKNYQSAGFKSVSLGGLSSTLYGDYGKKSGTSRDQTKQSVEESLKLLKSDVGAVLSEDPNAYLRQFGTIALRDRMMEFLWEDGRLKIDEIKTTRQVVNNNANGEMPKTAMARQCKQ